MYKIQISKLFYFPFWDKRKIIGMLVQKLLQANNKYQSFSKGEEKFSQIKWVKMNLLTFSIENATFRFIWLMLL